MNKPVKITKSDLQKIIKAEVRKVLADEREPFFNLVKNRAYKTAAGTWATPSSIDSALQLSKLFRNKIAIKDAPELLYGLVGDDDLYDYLSEEAKLLGSHSDARGMIATKLAEWLKNLNSFKEKWDPKAIALVQGIVNKFG